MPAASVILATAGYDHTIRFWEAPVCTCYRTVQYQDSVSESRAMLAAQQAPCAHVLFLPCAL